MHDGVVRCAVVPEGDERILVTGGDDCMLCVWRKNEIITNPSTIFNENEYGLVAGLHGHREKITCIAVSKPFAIIASGSSDSSVILWDLNRLHAVRQLGFTPSNSVITAICINHKTGDVCFASRSPAMLCVCDVNGKLLARFPDEREQTIKLINGEQEISTKTIDNITSLCIADTAGHAMSNSSALIVSGHEQGTIRVWNLRFASFQEIFTIQPSEATFDDQNVIPDKLPNFKRQSTEEIPALIPLQIQTPVKLNDSDSSPSTPNPIVSKRPRAPTDNLDLGDSVSDIEEDEIIEYEEELPIENDSERANSKLFSRFPSINPAMPVLLPTEALDGIVRDNDGCKIRKSISRKIWTSW